MTTSLAVGALERATILVQYRQPEGRHRPMMNLVVVSIPNRRKNDLDLSGFAFFVLPNSGVRGDQYGTGHGVAWSI
jgi:hypothetical protein